jgi:cysteine desulfurase/selenocysteine lyase
LEAFENALGLRTRLVAITHVSNALGTVNPVAEMIRMAHSRDVPVLVDGAQAVPHLEVDVQALDCDFYAFSGHKVYGPSGVGVLYGKARLLESMPPYQSGGEMIRSVSFERTQYKEIPYRFEAGTPDIVGVIGLGAAIDYVSAIGVQSIAAYESELLTYAASRVSSIPGVRIIGQARQKASVLSFVVDGAHAHDVGTILDQAGIAIRGGHHCAQPLMERFGLSATARASLGLYSTRAEVDALANGVRKVREIFGSCPS